MLIILRHLAQRFQSWQILWGGAHRRLGSSPAQASKDPQGCIERRL